MTSMRLSRPVGTERPFTLPQRRLGIPRVFIGNHRPDDHYAPAAQVFIGAADLYQNRRPKKSRAFKTRGKER